MQNARSQTFPLCASPFLQMVYVICTIDQEGISGSITVLQQKIHRLLQKMCKEFVKDVRANLCL